MQINLQDTIKNILNKLNFLSEDGKISITNLTVMLFVGITAFRGLFGGSTLIIHGFNWVIQTIDIASVLPVMFSLMSYSHKRYTNNCARNNNNDLGQKESP